MTQKTLVIIVLSIALVGVLFYIMWSLNINLFMKIKSPEALEAVADID